ncbi:PLP-dependent transferase [bacterium]|nr:PLP-dependent transferase [bacterium]
MSAAPIVNVTPVGGAHGVTVELPTVQMTIDLEEEKINIDRGYARIYPHPDVIRLEEEVATQYGAVQALSFCSPESALFTVMDALFDGKYNGIHVARALPKSMVTFLENTAGKIVPTTDPAAADILISQYPNLSKKSKVDQISVCFVPATEGQSQTESDIVILSLAPEEIGMVLFFNQALADTICPLRRNTGYNVYSRQVERQLTGISKPEFDNSVLKKRLADLEDGDPENTFLFSTGMGSISTAILTALSPQHNRLIMVGSPYVDTRLLLEKWPARRNMPETLFFEVDDLAGIRAAINARTALLICEIPTNPLVRLPDVDKIVAAAHAHKVPVLCDSTIASPYNFQPFAHEIDLIAHSTTKALNGMNDHIGGVLLTRDNTLGKRIASFTQLLQLRMDPADAQVLFHNLGGYEARIKKMNVNAQQLAEYLAAHPKVKEVNYPGLPTHPDFETARHYLRGNGPLLSFVLKGETAQTTPAFYDNLGAPVAKAPSIGSEQTLGCLYTMLTHYADPPEKLARMGLDLYLLRVSVGIELIEQIIDAFESALKQVRL